MVRRRHKRGTAWLDKREKILCVKSRIVEMLDDLKTDHDRKLTLSRGNIVVDRADINIEMRK